MQIAISSQNRRSITSHAGKCRNFWIYDIVRGAVAGKRLIELPIDQSFHASHDEFAAPLADINVLITGGLGNGLYLRLKRHGILAIVTDETDPDAAVQALLENRLQPLAVVPNNDCHTHDHAH